MQFNRLGLILRFKISTIKPQIINLNRNLSLHKLFQSKENLFQYRLKKQINILKRYSSIDPQQKNFFQKNFQAKTDTSTKNAVWYILSGFVIMIGGSYAAVPLFKLFCESQGIDTSTEFKDISFEKLKDKLKLMKKGERNIAVKFVASTSADLQWSFQPSQSEIVVCPGETALAFFKAKNLTDRSIVGIATYSILPFDAGLYFNKIQCFCFEEQRLDPNEEVDMPVFFYIDEQYAEDPKLQEIDEICLSYTFFESKGSENVGNMPKLATPFPSLV